MQADLSNQPTAPTVAPQNNEIQLNEQKGQCDALSCEKIKLLSSNEYYRRVALNIKNPNYKIQQDASIWIETEAPKRMKRFFSKIGSDKTVLQPQRRGQLLQHFDNMISFQLLQEKKCIRFQISKYEEDFNRQFGYYPNHDQKKPIKGMYTYYRVIKQSMAKKEEQQKKKIVELSKKLSQSLQQVTIGEQTKQQKRC